MTRKTARLALPPRSARHLEPDWAQVHQQLKQPAVTLQLLWEEYRQANGEQAYKYSAFCEKYKAWARRLQRSMRQTHSGGDKLFVDYAGQTVPVVDASTGERVEGAIVWPHGGHRIIIGATASMKSTAALLPETTTWPSALSLAALMNLSRPPAVWRAHLRRSIPVRP